VILVIFYMLCKKSYLECFMTHHSFSNHVCYVTKNMKMFNSKIWFEEWQGYSHRLI